MSREIRRRLKRKGLDQRAIKVYAHLHSHCYFGPRCWPSQKLIGQRCGMSRQLVNAVCQQLRDAGVLDWDRQHKRGSEYPVNVYTLRYWSRPKVAGTMRVLKRLNQCSQALPDTKGQQSRALPPEGDERHRDQSTGKGHRSLTADVRRTTSAGHTTTVVGRERENDFRRSSCMEAKRRHLHVADLTCPHCSEKQDELDRKDHIVKTLQLELNRAMEAEAAALEVAKASGKAAVAAKIQRTIRAREEATMEQVLAVVAHWRTHRPKTNAAFGEPTSKSFAVIEKALKLMKDDEAGPVAACKEAIDGLHMAPWQEYDQRFAGPGGPKRVLRNSVEHALGDEARIEKCRQIVRWSRVHAARTVDVARVVRAAADEWERRAFDEVFLRPKPEEQGPRFVSVDGLEVREDGR